MNRQSGQILIIALIFMAVILVFAGSLMGYTTLHVLGQRKGLAREQAINLAEAGIEKAVYELNWGTGQGYTGETNFSFGGGVIDIVVTSPSPVSRIVTATAYVPDKTNTRSRRVIQTELTIGTTTVAFSYGAQVGEGGLVMDNNSRVVGGSVYSNGSAIGGNGAAVDGDLWVAGASGLIDNIDVGGSAYVHKIDNATVGGNSLNFTFEDSIAGGNVSADTIRNCTVGGAATYNTKINCITISDVTPNPLVPPDPSPILMPITQNQIDDWEAEAEAGGTTNGDVTVTNGQTLELGPRKINGKLTLDNGATLVVKGTIWVRDEIELSNNSIMKLDPLFATLSAVILAGETGDLSQGYIEIDNGAIIQGSGVPGSYTMLLSQRNNPSSTAIEAGNNSNSAILYAGTGVIEIDNNAILKEITGWKLHLKNNATIQYETGLANVQFSLGPGGAWAVKRGTRVEHR